MNNNKIKITESQLRDIIKNAINEITFNGKELHGNDPNAWQELADYREYLDDLRYQQSMNNSTNFLNTLKAYGGESNYEDMPYPAAARVQLPDDPNFWRKNRRAIKQDEYNAMATDTSYDDSKYLEKYRQRHPEIMKESQLHDIIKESVKTVLQEFTKKPRLIKNPDRYMKRLAKRGKLQQVYKNQNVNARPVNDDEVGTTLTTYKKDPSVYGTEEKNVEVSKPLASGQYIVNNIAKPWQTYAVDGKTFNKKYYPSETEPGVYIPKGEDMMASMPLKRGVHFKPKNWGGYEASVDKGGRMMQSTKDKSDIYPIQKSDFDSTYAPRMK